MNEFQIGKSITISPNQKFNQLNRDEETGYRIITMPGSVIYSVNGIYPIRQYQHTVALCRVKMIQIKSNSKGEIYTAVYFDIVETKNSLLDAWDQIFIMDGTNKSGIDMYEDSKDAFIPGALNAQQIDRSHSGKDSPYQRSVKSDEIVTRRHSDRASFDLPDDFWK